MPRNLPQDDAGNYLLGAYDALNNVFDVIQGIFVTAVNGYNVAQLMVAWDQDIVLGESDEVIGRTKNNAVQTTVFSSNAIRTTAEQLSTIHTTGHNGRHTVYVDNGLNENVTVYIYGSHDATMAEKFTIDSFVVNAGTDGHKYVAEAHPYVRIGVVAASTPTSGALSARIYSIN